MFTQNYSDWIASAKDNSRIDTIVAVNTEEQKKEIETKFPNTTVIAIGDNLGVCKPIYEITKDLEINDDDILIAMFDDVSCIKNWDDYLEKLFIDYTGAVLINDGIQNPDVSQAPILVAITMPVMDGRTLKKLNRIIFHPDYMHYYADNEIYTNLTELNLIKDIRMEDTTVFQHRHYYKVNKRKLDAVDQAIIAKCGSPDRIVYDKRMALPLNKRLEV